MNDLVVIETLRAAVPLRIHELAAMSPALRANTLRAWAENAVDPITSRGDILQYGGRRGEAADVFSHLARGVAVLASSPGGVNAFGLIWCAEHSPSGTVSTVGVCAQCLGNERDDA